MKVPINEESDPIKSKFNKNRKFQGTETDKDLHRAELVFVDYDNEAY